MESQDVSSPTKPACPRGRGNSPLTGLSLDDNWEACSYILENCPDVIQDIESSLSRSKDGRSTRVLLGWDCDLNDHEDQELLLDTGQFGMEPKIDTGQAVFRTIKEENVDVFEEKPDHLVEMEENKYDVKNTIKQEEEDDDYNLYQDCDVIDSRQSVSRTIKEEEYQEPENLVQMEEHSVDVKESNQEEEETVDDTLDQDHEMMIGTDMLDDEMIVLDEEEDEDAYFDDNSMDEEFETGDPMSDYAVKSGRGSGLGSQAGEEGAEGEAGDEASEADGEEFEEDWYSDSDEDLDALLDEGLPEEYKQSSRDGSRQGKPRRKGGEVWRKVVPVGGSLPEGLIGVKEKTVLKKRGQEPLEGLPEGWIRISHQCGMPLYLHRPSRVCTWSRPYLLGSGSARRHHVPVASIPCLHYHRALDKEKNAENVQEVKGHDIKDNLTNGVPEEQACPVSNAPGEKQEVLPDGALGGQGSDERAEGSTSKDVTKKKSNIEICQDDSVDGKELHDYLSRLFQFEKIAIKRFKTWAARRKHTKTMKTKDRPQFPGGPKVIRCQIPGNKGREFVINAQDKTPVCILHEYSQRVMRTQPQYVFGVSNNASAPFEAVVEILGQKYGRGEASSKRLAKAEAAKATLDILVPELVADIKTKGNADTEYFDHVAIDDSRIYDLCVKAGQLTPWQVLQEYRQRSHGMTDTELKMDIKLKNHQRSQYTLTLGVHTVTGMCKNKTNGKQQGAQKLLKQLHPELSSWGAIIKMYGKGSSELNRAKREAEQSVIELAQSKRRSQPNREILNKLRMEMLKAFGEKEYLEEELERQKEPVEDMEEDEEKECS